MDSLVKIDGKPIEKLIEVVSNAIGELYEPRKLVRIARAEAESDRIKAIEGAKTEALLANDERRYAELTVIEKRVVAKELKRQNNINNVVTIAAQSLKDDKDVSSEPVNPDWATRFFDIAQDISDESMQNLWGRILAGEVKRPKSYSLRTLEALRNITREEAELLEQIAQYVLFDGSYYIYNDTSEKSENRSIDYETIAQLVEVGFIQPGSMVTQNYLTKGQSLTHNLFYGKRYIALIELPSSIEKISVPIYPLTKIGIELYKLITIKPDIEYFKNILQKIINKNEYISKDIRISYAELTMFDIEKDYYEYNQETIIEITHQSSAKNNL